MRTYHKLANYEKQDLLIDEVGICSFYGENNNTFPKEKQIEKIVSDMQDYIRELIYHKFEFKVDTKKSDRVACKIKITIENIE